MVKTFSVDMCLKQLKTHVSKLNELIISDEIHDDNQFVFDNTLVSIIELCLQLKVQNDLPEISLELDLHKHLILTGENFAYSQGQIKLVQQDNPS